MPGFGPPGYPLGKLVQQDGNMTRLAACAMGNLMAATGAIGHDNGGGILAHPDGPAAGVRALREAWDAAIAGIPLTEHARNHQSLRQAISGG